LPPLRQTQLALAKSVSHAVAEETDLVVDGVNTMAELLARDAARRAEMEITEGTEAPPLSPLREAIRA
jgi:hypothetical protein